MDALSSLGYAPQSLSWESTFTLPAPDVHLRPLQKEDLRKLEWHGGADLRGFYWDQWENHQSGDVLVVVASLRDFPIGQAAIHWFGKPTRPHIPDIQSVRVIDALRGQGIGSHLLKTCEAIVRSQGHLQYGLAVALDNPNAKRLYERLGFRVIGAAYHDKWSYENAQGETVHVDELVTDMVKDLR